MDNEDAVDSINYSTFEVRNLQHCDFVKEVKVIKANNLVQLSIKGDKSVYIYQYGSMDFAFDEENLATGIHALHRVFEVPSCPVHLRRCPCGKIYRNPVYVTWCMINRHDVSTCLGENQIWMDSNPTAFYIPSSIIDLLLNENGISNLPINILDPLAYPYSCIELGNHKFPSKNSEKNYEHQLFDPRRNKKFTFLSIVKSKRDWLKKNRPQETNDGSEISCRSQQYKSLPLLLRMSYIKGFCEWPDVEEK